MARKIRVEFEGANYHVMCRGDRREKIFEDDGRGRSGPCLNNLTFAIDLEGHGAERNLPAAKERTGSRLNFESAEEPLVFAQFL